MNAIAQRLEAVRRRLRAAERQAGRAAGAVGLIAVGKTWPAEDLAQAYAQGQRDFGENYLQEALAKQDALRGLDIVWHFIGPIQSNKTKPLAERFQWVHGVDRLKIAQRLSEQRPESLPPLHICLQVNVSGEASKAGVAPVDLPALAQAVAGLPRLRLRGLMAIPAAGEDFDAQRLAFRTLREAMQGLGMAGLDTLSMGMSDDLEAAVLEGATWVRVGTAIFGERQKPGAASPPAG
ncbi:MAG: YggS family pyridoxal phosphate-dependent enzyme [Methylococcus sp.]